jgi:hypothetical protein
MMNIIYNISLYGIISINILIVKILIYYIYTLYNKYLIITNKEKIKDFIREVKTDLINDYDKYTDDEITEYIDDIIQIYINLKCDFAEDYEDNIKIVYSDIDVFILTKKMQLLNFIDKNKKDLNI